MDAIIISDLHLGSDLCLDRQIIDLLEQIKSDKIQTNRLILNGDVFDSHDFRRLNKRHWKILSLLRKLSDDIEVIWLCGNHDGPADIVSHLIGLTVMDEYILVSGDKKILCLHGHQFDTFLDEHPVLTAIADFIYFWLQKIDTSHRLPRYVKHSSKTFLRCSDLVKKRALKHGKRLGVDVVCTGHTHHPAADGNYYNSGSWTEKPCTYIKINDGIVELCVWQETAQLNNPVVN